MKKEADWVARLSGLIYSAIVASLDVALMYLVIDLANSWYTMSWGFVVTIWWVMQIIFYNEYLGDYRNGLIS